MTTDPLSGPDTGRRDETSEERTMTTTETVTCLCMAQHDSGKLCTRARGHSGAHVALYRDGSDDFDEVVAVWDDASHGAGEPAAITETSPLGPEFVLEVNDHVRALQGMNTRQAERIAELEAALASRVAGEDVDRLFDLYDQAVTEESAQASYGTPKGHRIANDALTAMRARLVAAITSRVAGEPITCGHHFVSPSTTLTRICMRCGAHETRVAGEPAAKTEADEDATWLRLWRVGNIVGRNHIARFAHIAARLATRPSGAGAEAIVVTDAMRLDWVLAELADLTPLDRYNGHDLRDQIDGFIAAAGTETGAR